MNRYPEGTTVDPEAFRACGWKAVVSQSGRDGYSSMWSALCDAAKRASEAKEFSKAKALWLLADAASLMLKPESFSEPFKPLFVLDTCRSPIPDDFDQEALSWYQSIAAHIDEEWLRARVFDLLWLRVQPRRVEFARAAIDAYTQIPITGEAWLHGGRECWERALVLAERLGQGAEGRIEKISSALSGAFLATTESDGRLPLGLARVMREYGRCGSAASLIAAHLHAIADILSSGEEIAYARDLFDEASKWHSLGGDKEREAEANIALADSFIREARIRVSGATPSHAVGASFLASAIQALRRIPRGLRDKNRVDERIAETHREMTSYGERVMGELGTIASPSVDLTERVERARNAVRDKPLAEAVLALAKICGTANLEQDREFAKSMIREYPLNGLFAVKFIASDGRVVAKQFGAALGDLDSDEQRFTVWSQMMRHHSIHVLLAVQGSILPAVEVVVAQHRLRETDLVLLARKSTIVPDGREGLFGKALFFGFEGDYAASIHLLVPQMEHLVRVHLKSAGHQTTVLGPDGIEQEKGLSKLMEGPEADQVLGADLAYEIRALFCGPIGPNLRNDVAHGLLSDSTSQTPFTCYAWWLGLRMVFLTFWSAAANKVDANSATDDRPQASDRS